MDLLWHSARPAPEDDLNEMLVQMSDEELQNLMANEPWSIPLDRWHTILRKREAYKAEQREWNAAIAAAVKFSEGERRAALRFYVRRALTN